MNIVDLVTWQALRRPKAPAILRKTTVISYARLDGAVAHIAERIAAQGLAPGQRVGVAMRTSPMHLMVLLALARLGAVSLPVSPGELPEKRKELVERFRLTTIVSDFREYAVEGAPLLLVDPDWSMPPAAVTPPRAAAPEHDAPWRITLSSGTTGLTKGIYMRHAQMLSNVLLQRTVVRVGADQRYLCFRDLDAAAGLRPCLIHLAAGGAVIFPSETEPADFYEAAERHGATHASASPGLLRSLVAAAPRKGAPSLKHFEIGGAALQFALAEEAAAKITPHVLSTYGASETGRIAIAPIALLRREPGCSGWFVPWVESQALDDDGRVLPPGERGALRFRGIGFASEYVDDAEASAKAFRDGWFWPGDAGRIDRRGLLFVEGRVDDLVNLGGAKIAPSAVEKVLETHPAVVEAAAFGAKSAQGVTRLYAAVVTREPVEEKALIAHCRAKLGSMAPGRIFTMAALPRNENGKLLRRELASRVVSR